MKSVCIYIRSAHLICSDNGECAWRCHHEPIINLTVVAEASHSYGKRPKLAVLPVRYNVFLAA
jgi:hypothetical protein